MNKWEGTGRLTRDPDVRWSQGQDQKCTARFTLAVNRRVKTDGGQQADFISCIAFGKTAEWIEKWTKQGTRVEVTGRIQTGSYTNREGQKVYTTDIVVEEIEFGESKKSAEETGQKKRPEPKTDGDGFMNIPDEVDDEGLPFN